MNTLLNYKNWVSEIYFGQECLYQVDSYLNYNATKIIECKENTFRCDKVILYPSGGGQLFDTGWVNLQNIDNKFEILGCRKEADGIWYECTNHPFLKNSIVEIKVNNERRGYHMRLHTALHVLCSICPFPVTGCKINNNKASIDFNIGEHSLPGKEIITEELHKIIKLDYPIKIQLLDRSELESNDKLEKYRYLTEKLPDSVGNKLRLVVIGDNYNVQLCGGTHVSSTSKIKAVVASKIENKGRKNRRVVIQISE